MRPEDRRAKFADKLLDLVNNRSEARAQPLAMELAMMLFPNEAQNPAEHKEIYGTISVPMRDMLGGSKNSKDIEMCAKIWKSTLEHFNAHRPVLPHEHMKIAQLVKTYGATAVAYAFVGMRHEERTQTFDPAKNLSLARCQDEKLFEKFLNLGSIEKTKRDRADAAAARNELRKKITRDGEKT
jgi:hypothetical protein